MAGQGKKTFTAGDTLTASQVNDYLMDQSVMRFASAAARNAAIPSPTEGMVCYLDDVNQIWYHNGSGWQLTGGDKPLYFGSSTTATANSTWVVGAVTAIVNRGGFANTGGNITIPVSGVYQVSGYASIPASATGFRLLKVIIGGGEYGVANQLVNTAGYQSQIGTSFSTYIAAGNVLNLQIFQNSGVSQNVSYTLTITYLGS
jgi:hypothetical protein